MGKKAGGMGMRNMKLQKAESHDEMVEEICIIDNMLWKDFICAKYGLEDNFKVGDGQKVSFWNDNWIGQSSFETTVFRSLQFMFATTSNNF